MAKKKRTAPKTEETPTVEETTAEGVLGALIPGLGKLVSSLKETSPAFKQRLEETNTEIEKRIAAGGSKKPVIDYDIRIRTLGGEEIKTFKPEVKKGVSAAGPRPNPPQRSLDIFNEKKEVLVVTEMPEVNGKDIDIKVNEDVIEISAPGYYRRIKLPAKVREKPAMKLKNGILELRFAKKE